MRNIVCLLLGAAGMVWVAVWLARRQSLTHSSPTREAERLLERCRDLLDDIESAARNREAGGVSSR